MSWNEEIDTCFNVESVSLARNFDFPAHYLVVLARWLVNTGGCCSLLMVTARYRSFLVVPTFSMNDSDGLARFDCMHCIMCLEESI